jgi:predicted Zn-dependent peptidase
VPPDRVVAALDEELEALAAEGPTPEELARVTARWASNLHREHDRIISRTLALGSFELLHGRAELVGELPERIAAVTVDAVAAAAKNMRPDTRAVLTVSPAGGA